MKRFQSLGARFFSALFFLLVLGILAFGLIVARGAGDEVELRSAEIMEQSGRELETVFSEIADTQAELMDQSVTSLSAKFGRELADIPFDLYEGREADLEALLRERLDEMRARNRENSGIIADLFRENEGEVIRQKLLRIDQQQKETVGEWRRSITRRLLVWGGAFLLTVSGLTGFAFFVTVLRPLRAATEVIESMGRGNLRGRIREDGSEEIVRLATSFNSMAVAVEQAQQGLEEKVAQKTKALSQALRDQETTNVALQSTLAELENTQEKLVDTAKMVALGTMAQGMAHEFNNIIGGIRGCAQELKDELSAELKNVAAGEEAVETLDVIIRTSERASLVTENLLSFSRGVAGELSPLSLAEVASTALRLVDSEAAKKGVEFRLTADELPTIESDVRGLQQVFLNLYLNALQASSPGKVVDVRIEAYEHGQRISVRDEGEGIKVEHLGRLFEPFFTTKSGSSAGGGGSGLGLAVSHGIVTRLGGQIEVSSEGPACGSQFVVDLPSRDRIREES